MPLAMERKLKKQVRKMGAVGKSVDEGAYVYGTMQKRTNWRPGKRKHVGRGDWGPKEGDSAGGSKTVMSQSEFSGR